MSTELNVSKVGIKELLKVRQYTMFLASNFISRFGDSLDSIAYGWMVYMLTGSKLLLGTLFAVNAIPSIIISPFAGVLVDRLPKKKVIVVGDLLRGVTVFLTASLFGLGLLRPWHLFLFTIFNSTFEAFTRPASISFLTRLVDKPFYLSANSLMSSVTSFAELIGLALAGVIISQFGIAIAILIDSATFLISSMIVLLIKYSESPVGNNGKAKNTYLDDLKDGFKFLAKHRMILTAMVLSTSINFCLSPFNVLQTVYVKDVLKSGPEGLSFLGIGVMSGIILGGLAVGQYGSRIKRHHLIGFGGMGLGLCYAFLGIAPQMKDIVSPLYAASVFCFGIGFLIPFISSPTISYIMGVTPREYMGRVSSCMGMMSLSAVPLGACLSGIVSEYVAIPLLFIIMGIAVIAIFFSALFMRGFKEA